jgi:hypothetical protein
LSRLGIQYADLSPGARHAVPPAASRDAVVELAFVLVLPMNVWSWDLPGCPG